MNKFGITPAEVIGEMHPLFRPMIWVAQARSNDETRFVINQVQVEKNDKAYTIVATDGRRLHVAEFDPGMVDEDFPSLEEGAYEVISKGAKYIVVSKVEDAGKYPNWRAITGDYTAGFYEASVDPKTASIVCMRTGVLLANDFLAQAIGHGNGFKKTAQVALRFNALDPNHENSVIRIEHELGAAYVMPLRQPGDDEVTGDEGEDPNQPTTPIIPGLEAEEEA